MASTLVSYFTRGCASIREFSQWCFMVAQLSKYTIAADDREIVVRLPSGFLDQESLSKFLDYLELESLRRRSQLSQEQADELAKEINQAMWKQLRAFVEKG